MLARMVDTVLEMTVVPGFSRAGMGIRRRLYGWTEETLDLSTRTVVLTGVSDGAGEAIALRLAQLGAETWITDTTEAEAAESASSIASLTGNERVHGLGVDMGEFQSVRELSDRLHAATDGVDVLIHNAGGLYEERTTTSIGVEETVAAHVLGPYILTRRLEDHLRAGARVLFMASGGMYTQQLKLVGLEMAARNYKGNVAHARAKRAQVELARLLAEDYKNRFVVHSMHPGWTQPNGAEPRRLRRLMTPLLRSPEEAADTMVWLATADEATNTSGDFWHDRARRRTRYLPRAGPKSGDAAGLIPWIEARIRKAER